MARTLKIPAFLALITVVLMSYSCKEESCQDNGTCPEQSVLEKLDYDISGEFSYSDDLQSEESDKSVDLVTYSDIDDPADVITFRLHLANGHTLKLHVHNTQDLNPWEHVNLPYAIYPTQDLEDKTEYVIAEYYVGTEVPAYQTNLGTNYPPGDILDAFEVTLFNEVEIHCRMRDIVLYKTIDPTKTITIDGTFIGAVTFL